MVGMLAIWWRSAAGVPLLVNGSWVFILHCLRSVLVGFSGCCPDLMPVCNDGSNASVISGP